MYPPAPPYMLPSSKSSVILRFSCVVARARRALQLPSTSRARNGRYTEPAVGSHALGIARVYV